MSTETPKFWGISQVPALGKSFINRKRGIGHNIIIEANNLKHAISRFKEIGLWFDKEECKELPCSRHIRWKTTAITEHTQMCTSETGKVQNLNREPDTLFFHMESGEVVNLSSKCHFSRTGAIELLNLIHNGRVYMRGNDVSLLQKYTAEDNKHPSVFVLDKIKRPTKTTSRFQEHEYLFEALTEGRINQETYDYHKQAKTELKLLKVVIPQRPKQNPKVNWAAMDKFAHKIREQMETLQAPEWVTIPLQPNPLETENDDYNNLATNA